MKKLVLLLVLLLNGKENDVFNLSNEEEEISIKKFYIMLIISILYIIFIRLIGFILSSLILQVIDGVKDNFILNLNSKIIKPDLQLAIFADEKVIQERLEQREKLTRFEKNNQSRKELINMQKGIEKLKKLKIKVLCVNNSDNLESNVEKITNYIIDNWRRK